MGRRKKEQQLELEEVVEEMISENKEETAPRAKRKTKKSLELEEGVVEAELNETEDDIDIEDSEDAEEAVDFEDSLDSDTEEEEDTTEDYDDAEFQEDHDIELPKTKVKNSAKKKVAQLIAKPWKPNIKKNIPIPPRNRSGKWQRIASSLEVGECIDNLDSRQAAIGLASAIKTLGGNAKFRQLSSGVFAVWRIK